MMTISSIVIINMFLVKYLLVNNEKEINILKYYRKSYSKIIATLFIVIVKSPQID